MAPQRECIYSPGASALKTEIRNGFILYVNLFFSEIIIYLHHFPSWPPSKPSRVPLLALSNAQLPKCVLPNLTGETDGAEGRDVTTTAADAFGERFPLFSLGKNLGPNWGPQLVSSRRPGKAGQAFPRPQLSRLKEKLLLLLLPLLLLLLLPPVPLTLHLSSVLASPPSCGTPFLLSELYQVLLYVKPRT